MMDNKSKNQRRMDRYYSRIAEWKEILGGKCAECGSTNDLQFDHIDPATKVCNMTTLFDRSKYRIDIELSKCQLLCELCHLGKKTILDKGQTVVKYGNVHGTLTSYRYCKCEICRKAKSEYTAAHRKNVPKSIIYVIGEIVHGTRAGYLKEVRLKIPRCEACRKANTEYTRELKNRVMESLAERIGT